MSDSGYYPIKVNRPVLITLCPTCSKAWHGIIFDADALYDKETLNELVDYAKSGREMKVMQAQTYEWCECNQKQP